MSPCRVLTAVAEFSLPAVMTEALKRIDAVNAGAPVSTWAIQAVVYVWNMERSQRLGVSELLRWEAISMEQKLKKKHSP